MSFKYALIENGVITQVIMSPGMLHFNDAEHQWDDISFIHPSPAERWIKIGPKAYEPPPVSDVDLQRMKEDARVAIETAARHARQIHMPDEYGQSELYREKYEQAIDFLSSQDTVQYTDYPLLHIESKILEVSMKIIAENIIKRRSEWISKITQIEELRLYGKVHIAFCTSEGQIQLLVSHIGHKLGELGKSV